MNAWKHMLSFVLAGLMVCALPTVTLTSCADDTVTDTPTDTTGDPSAATTAPETTSPYDPGLPLQTFEDYTFTFAVRGKEGDPYLWNNTDILATEETGEVLNDSIFKRNNYMRDKHGVTINAIFAGNTGTSTTGSEMFSYINRAVLAQSAEFDAILSSPYDSIGYVVSDLVLDLTTVENLDLNRSWWDQNALKQLAFGDKIFITTGEVTIIDNKATHAYAFNKQMIKDLGLDDPYEVVKSGKWTLEKLATDAAIATSDLNGDSKIDETDRWGLWYWQDACFTFITSCGNAFGRINAQGEPELTLNTERMISTWEKVNQLITSGDAFEGMPGDPDAKTTFAMFGGWRVLYAWQCISDILELRESDVEFGIIPAPKYDEAQEEYITSPHAFGNTMMTIPTTCSDTARTGYILEVFTAKSAELVTPAFYEITLKTKASPDQESAEMLDLIFATKFYDIGYFFQWGNLGNSLMGAFNSKLTGFSTIYKRFENMAIRDMEKIADKFK